MALTLASAWYPRGELPRLMKLLPLLREVYQALVITLPPDVDGTIQKALDEMGQQYQGQIMGMVTTDWSWGRYQSLQAALATPATHIHYVDLDRLLRWIETRPQEWRQTAQSVSAHDCLIIGRTPAAYASHPQALVQTEAISNLVASYLLSHPVDVSAGSKGFSRQAAGYLVAHCQPGRALGSDAEWPVTLMRAGFAIDYVEVDGLDWEIPDQGQPGAANTLRQRQIAIEYDADPENWKRRVAVAFEIVQSGIEASTRMSQ